MVDTPEPPLPDVAGVEAHKAEQRDAIDSLLDVMNAEKRWKAERSPAAHNEFLRTFLSAVGKYVHLLAGTDDLIEGTADQAVLATLAEQRTGIAETAERLVGELQELTSLAEEMAEQQRRAQRPQGGS